MPRSYSPSGLLTPRRKAFTLLEIVIATALMSVVLLSVAQFILSMIRTRGKTESATELQQYMRYALLRIEERTINSTVIQSAATGLLSLGTGALLGSQPPNPPTVFYLSGSTLFMLENNRTLYALTPPRVTVNSARFINRTAPPGPQAIDIELQGSTVDPSGVTDSFDLQSTVMLRQ